jgi:hypothetical protein
MLTTEAIRDTILNLAGIAPLVGSNPKRADDKIIRAQRLLQSDGQTFPAIEIFRESSDAGTSLDVAAMDESLDTVVLSLLGPDRKGLEALCDLLIERLTSMAPRATATGTVGSVDVLSLSDDYLDAADGSQRGLHALLITTSWYWRR